VSERAGQLLETKYWDMKLDEGRGNHCAWRRTGPPASLPQVVTASKVTQPQTLSLSSQLHLA